MYLARTSLRSARGPVDLAFTGRFVGARGLDAPEAETLDLALDADPAALARVVEDFAPGTAVVQMRQVHGASVTTILSDATAQRCVPECDALVTTAPDVTLVVRVADCVPVLLADTEAGVVGAVHAGRQGVAGGVVVAALAKMAALGARDVVAWIGPHVCGACYEVPPALQEEVAAGVPETLSTTRWGTTGLDLGAGVRAQLRDHGARLLEEPASVCTMEHPGAWSHRRDGAAAGRMAGLVRRRGADR